MSTQPQIPPRPDGLHPVPAMPAPPEVSGDSRPTATWSWYEAIGVYLLGFVLAGLATLPVLALMDEGTDLTTVIVNALAAVVLLGVLLVWLTVNHRGWLEVMRLPEPGSWLREIGTAVVFGAGLAFAINVVIGRILEAILEAFSDAPVSAPPQVGEDLSAVGVAFTILYAVVIAPIGEELFFRGVLFRAIRDRHTFWIGAVGSGVAFGLIHFIPDSAADSALLMLGMFFTGVSLCYLYERRGTIVSPVVAHVTYNVLVLTLILTRG